MSTIAGRRCPYCKRLPTYTHRDDGTPVCKCYDVACKGSDRWLEYEDFEEQAHSTTSHTPVAPTDFQRENRYIVIKRSHASEDALSRIEGTMDNNDVTEVEDALVVESDWPEYELVWQMIEARVLGKPTVAVAEVIATGGPHDKEDRVLCELQAELPPIGTKLYAYPAERDKMLAEFVTELTLAITDHQVRSAMTQAGRTKCMELLQRYNQR